MICFLSVTRLPVETVAASLYDKIPSVSDCSGQTGRLPRQVFLDNIETFITQLDSTNHLNLFLTELRSVCPQQAAVDQGAILRDLKPACDWQGGGHRLQHVPSARRKPRPQPAGSDQLQEEGGRGVRRFTERHGSHERQQVSRYDR